MIQQKLYLIIFLFISCSCVCRSELYIHGVSRICTTPSGRWGKCVSKDKCHHHVGCDLKASVWPCSNGLGDPPHVCCVFGKGIVFPDDDFVVDVKPGALSLTLLGPPTAVTPPATTVKSRHNTALESRNGIILFPNENGKFETLSPPLPLADVTDIKLALEKQFEEQNNELNLFPKDPVCGPMVVGDKIHGGREAVLGEFPWLANLEYRKENGDLEIACAGNIINYRYVLTAGHCVKGPIEEKLGKLESLRVGDHNINTSQDCDEHECMDPYQRFGIVEAIVHKDYRYTKKGRIFYDIALLKTDHNIRYSLYIAPICLPEVMPSLEAPIGGTRMTVAGWGHNGTDYTDEKRIVDVPYVEESKCAFRLLETQMCAGGETGKDSCTGDSGGSLARRTPHGWIMEGIVSYGRGCGTENPAIYTRVRKFIPWIHEQIEQSMRADVRPI